jgi:hypothetical protein
VSCDSLDPSGQVFAGGLDTGGEKRVPGQESLCAQCFGNAVS